MNRKVKSILRDLIWVGGGISTSTHAIGGGEWSIEVSVGEQYCCEFVGSNGTQNDEEADDLHSIVSDAIAQAEAIYEFMESRWPEKMKFMRFKTQLENSGVSEINLSENMSVYSTSGWIDLLIINGEPSSIALYRARASKEEVKQFVKLCVKKGLYPSKSATHKHWQRTVRNYWREREKFISNRG